MADAALRSLQSFFVQGRVSETRRGDLDATFQELVEVARTGDGRQRLAEADVVPALLSLHMLPTSSHDVSDSSWSFNSFYLFVKLLRNLSAGNGRNQEALVASGGVEALARVMEVLAPQYGSPREGLQIVLQLLGNVAQHGDAAQTLIWNCFFPSVFTTVAVVADAKVHEPLCMVLYTCCRESDTRCSDVAQAKGVSILASLLNRGAAPKEWLEFLVFRLAFGSPGLPALFTTLGGTGWSVVETKGFTEEQAALLDVLNASLSARQEESHSNDVPGKVPRHSSTLVSFLVDLIRAAAEYAASTNLSGLKLPTGSPGADVLGLSLSVARILCALDVTTVPTFASCGMVPLLLNLLRALGVPDNAKATPTPMHVPDSRTSSFPKRDVYTGYRRDVVAVIANASHRSVLIQDLVRENGGLLVVLQQCMPDSNNPFLREWGLWTIRNLLEGNIANQTDLAALEIQSTVPDARLEEAGMRVEINPDTGRPRLVNAVIGTDGPAADEFM